MKNRLTPEQASQIQQRLSSLAENDCTKLRQFAERRLARLGASTSLAEDVVQRAFQTVLIGLESADEGRRPAPKDVATPENFEKYMFSVIASVCDAMLRKREFQCIHLPIREEREDLGEHERGVAIASPESVRVQAHVADLKQTLFPLLRSRAHWTLIPTIAAWEDVFEHSDRIPAAGRHRKYVGEVRKLAAEIVNDLGGLS
jgi:DNA-directed RNA polymerase specialized sigma24 family protein